MAHGEVVTFIKNITGDTMEMSVERGELVVPNMTDCFPIKSEADLEKMTEEERKLYWQEAMKAADHNGDNRISFLEFQDAIKMAEKAVSSAVKEEK